MNASTVFGILRNQQHAENKMLHWNENIISNLFYLHKEILKAQDYQFCLKMHV